MRIFPMDGRVHPPKNELVLIDTNVITRLLGYHNSSNVDVTELKDFITTLAVNGNILVHSIKTVEEISNVMHKQVLARLKPGYPPRTNDKQIIRCTPDFYVQVSNEVESVWNAVKALPHFYETPIGNIDNNVLTLARSNALSHRLAIADAIIYTQAKIDGIQHIISCDKDFTTINDPEVTLYLDSANYTKHINP